MRFHRVRPVFLATIAAVVAIACADTPTSLVSTGRPLADETVGDSTPQVAPVPTNLIACTGRTPAVSVATVGPLGGSLSVGGASIDIPAGAVSVPTSFTISVPGSDIAEVDISAAGVEHFVFDAPVTVTLSYDGCAASEDKPLAVWYIDPATRTLLEHMGGTVDRAAKTVTFTTGHLSGYAIAD